jgi:pimeloyl-ACP methyl ester carboxylesterase
MTTNGASTPVSFEQGFVEADGFRIRYLEAGEGDPLVVLHGGGGLRHYTSHDLLARSRRVILMEAPGFGDSPANERSQTMGELADAMAEGVANLGIEQYDLQGTSFGGKLALWWAVRHPERLKALVLVGPAAIRLQDGFSVPREQLRFYAHPERQQPQTPAPPEVREKQMALTRRIMGPARDADLEARMADLQVPVLVVIGTLDNVIPPEMGRHYREILPNCNVVFLYDAAHEADADRPEAFVDLVNDFLERHEAFIVTTRSGLIHQ